MDYAVVTVKKGEARSLKAGGLWIYDNEIASVMGSVEDGGLVIVHDFDGFYLGTGFINRHSKITVRILTREKNTEIDEIKQSKKGKGNFYFFIDYKMKNTTKDPLKLLKILIIKL